MIRNRSFHASVYHKKRNEIYVIGGNQGGNVMTIPFMECLDIVGNVFVEKK